MNFVKKIILLVKNIFNKPEEVKKLEAPQEMFNKNEKINFIESLKINSIEKRKNNKVETLICEGDGLGIQQKISS